MKLSEQAVTAQIKNWLEIYGWTGIRLQSGTVRGLTRNSYITLNKKHTPDWVFFRERECLFVEMKATGKKPNAGQLEWIAGALARKTPALWANSIDSFLKAYWKLFPI